MSGECEALSGDGHNEFAPADVAIGGRAGTICWGQKWRAANALPPQIQEKVKTLEICQTFGVDELAKAR